MEFRILGSFDVVGTTGPIDVRGAKRRGLLACLLAHAGQPLSTDRLVDELWGEAGSDSAARTVQTYVSQLRKLLADESGSLDTRPGGYVLEIDAEHVDAFRFEQTVHAAGAEPEAGRRLAVVDEALALWRGPPLAEFAGAGWADREAARLEALHLQALKHRYDALMALGRAGEAAAELELLVSAHPLDERLWAQLMLALYRSGRQADALSAYQQARRHLVNELGIEPGPELARLEHRILDHDPALAGPTERLAASDEHKAPAGTMAEGWYPRTFLLTDIVDSVSLWERDPAGMSQTVARHDALVHDAVNAAGGELVRAKGEGDSTFSVFTRPVDALAAVAAIHQAVAAEQWPSAAQLRVRAGVHTGDAEPRDGDWYGPAVNRAARLRALADGGQTLLSGVTAGLAADQPRPGMRLLYQGRRAMRGIERPEDVWELVAADDPKVAAPTVAQIRDLPLALTSFVGRTADLDTLGALVQAERLVTLTGPGGSGKTRLALELARRVAHRGKQVWLAELAPLRDGSLVAQVVATAVGIEAGPEPLDDLLARPELLAGLLVLDNCEHLLDACAAFTTAVLTAAPELRVVGTSREPLGLGGEREWPVTPLDVPDESVRDRDRLARVASVELLVDRARAVRPDFEVSDGEIGSVVHICTALDGMPLAIELAAGRLRSLTLAGLAARLDDQLGLLARRGSTGGDDVRHQTLRMTLDWSYDLLGDQQRTLARRLSVFAGGFRLDAVEAVCAAQVDVLDGVDELVAKSLVTFDAENARYRLLEPLRQYLAERLDQADETEVLRQTHAEWVADLCDRLGIGFVEEQATRSRRLREETSNIDLALRWALDNGDRETARRIVGSLGHYCFYYDQASGRRWCDLVTAIDTDAPSVSRAKVLVSAGMVAQNDQAWDRSVTLLREALRIYRREEAADGQAASLLWLGRALANWTDPDHNEAHASEARQCFEESIALYTRLGDQVGAAWGRILLSAQAFWNHDLDRSEQLANEVVRDCHAAGVRHPMGAALGHLAFIARRRGDNDTALELLQDAVALSRDLDVAWQVAGFLVDLAAHQATVGQGDQALQALAESTQLDAQLGRLPGRSVRLAVAALVHHARRQPALSTAALGAYDAHPVGTTGWGRPVGAAGSIGWLADAMQATRAQLDPAEIAAETAAARGKTLDELMDELILQPANTAR